MTAEKLNPNEQTPSQDLSMLISETSDRIRKFSGGNYRDTLIRNLMQVYCEPHRIDFWLKLPQDNTEIRLNEYPFEKPIGGFMAQFSIERIAKTSEGTCSTIYGCKSGKGVKQYANGHESEITEMDKKDMEEVKTLLETINSNIPIT